MLPCLILVPFLAFGQVPEAKEGMVPAHTSSPSYADVYYMLLYATLEYPGQEFPGRLGVMIVDINHRYPTCQSAVPFIDQPIHRPTQL